MPEFPIDKEPDDGFDPDGEDDPKTAEDSGGDVKWITAENGKRIQINEETGEILKGNIGQGESKGSADKRYPNVCKLNGNEVQLQDGENWRDAGLRAYDDLRKNVKNVVIEGFGTVELTRRGVRKLREAQTDDELKAKIVPAIPDVLRNGYRGNREPLKKERNDGIVAFYFITASVEIGGDIVPVGASIGEHKTGRLFYNINHNPEEKR